MPLFSTSNLTRYFNQGEQNVCNEQPFIVDRLSLNIIGNQAPYELPDYVLSIRRITYLGMKLDPLPRRNQNEVFQSANQVGRPFWYVYNNIGANIIRLFPTPPSDIAPVTNIWDTDIGTGVIIEFYRMTDNATFVIPSYWRTALLKRYTAHMARTVQGKGQQMKLGQYYHDQWKLWKNLWFTHLSELHTKPRKIIVNEIVSSNYYPASPILPISRFGISVDEGG